MEEPAELPEHESSRAGDHSAGEKAGELGEEGEEWEAHSARRLARAHLAKQGEKPYLISTLPRAEMHRLGVVGALWIALIGVALLAGALVMRFG